VTVEIGDGFDDVELVTDGTMLQRALLNLLLNAVEATQGHGQRVQIKLASHTEQCVTIDVCDEGPGIDPDTMECIFNPFFTTKGTGTGLGLAIVHQVIEALGGSVRVANRPDGGALFSLVVPCQYQPSPEPVTISPVQLDRVKGP
jgi:signal transduction histidine kinase